MTQIYNMINNQMAIIFIILINNQNSQNEPNEQNEQNDQMFQNVAKHFQNPQ